MADERNVDPEPWEEAEAAPSLDDRMRPVFLGAMRPAQVLDAFLALPEADIETLQVGNVLKRATPGAETRRCLASLLARLGLPGADALGTLQVGHRFAPRAGIRPVEFLTGFARHLDATEP